MEFSLLSYNARSWLGDRWLGDRFCIISRRIFGPKSSTKGPASQGTPPNSPAAVSAFSRVVAASQTNKQVQNQVQGNPLGLAAVLLQGAQGKSGGESGPRGKHGRIDLETS